MRKRFISILLTLCLVLTLLPATAFATEWTTENTITDGWYNLRSMNNYLNFTVGGAAELRKLSANEAFYVESKGGNQYTLKMKDGRYLGLDDTRKDGARVKAVNSPYTWLIHWEATNFNKEKSDIFSLRPPEAVKLVVNASGEKNADGTPIIIWSHEKLDAPNHAEFRFIPITTTTDTTGESWTTYTENGLVGYKDPSGNVVIKAQYDGAEKFSQGIAKVNDKAKGAVAYIDTTGKLITPFKYYPGASGHIVYDGLMRVAVYGDDVVKAIMNGDGVYATESVGNNTVVVMKSGKKLKFDPKYGFIDKTGKEVIPLQFDEAYSFQDGLATVLKYQGWQYGVTLNKIGYIDTTGKMVIPYKYGGDNMYDGIVFCYKDGLTCFFEYLGKEGVSADGRVKYAPGGIMDKTGKVIVPSNPNRYYPSRQFGLQWKDGVIVNCYSTEVNAKGVPTKGGGKEWSFTELYDYSGKLIKKLDGYTAATPLGGGYTLALHQLPTDAPQMIEGSMYIPGYWTVFDRNGNIVLDNLQKNNFDLLNKPHGYANGYVYFGGEGYKVSSIAAPGVPAPSTQAPFLKVQEGVRLSGDDRYKTAAAISKNGWALSDNVFIANSNSFSGALIGSSLAYLKDAPVLLTETKSLSPDTAKELERLGAKTIYIIGNENEVSLNVENALKAKYQVIRISGSDQFNTAVNIGEEVKKVKAFDTVALATQNNFPDALAITPYSAKETMPILFSGKDKLRDDTRAALLSWEIKKVVIAGGTGVISQAVEDDLKKMGLNVTRLAGEDRYDTALAIVKHYENTPYTKITLATGLNYPDALTGAALAAKKGLPLLLVEKENVKKSVKDYLDTHKLEQAYIFGGEGVIGKKIVGK